MTRFIKLTWTVLLCSNIVVWGQTIKKVSKADSLIIKGKIESFYSWYADQIKNQKEDFKPSFVKRADGMTTLNFKKYVEALKQHGFTDRFVKRNVKSYQACVDNLAKVKYETFLKFDGLDNFEEIKCDFGNVNEWTRDQDQHDGADLIGLKIIDKRTILGTIQFFNIKADGGKYIWDYKQATVTFLRQGNDWKIEDFKIDWL